MSAVKQVLEEMVNPVLTADDLAFGAAPPIDFTSRLESAFRRNRAGFWISAGMLLILFGVVLLVTYRHFDQLINVGATGITGVFGISAGGVVILMLRLYREYSRAEYLLILLSELRESDRRQFATIVLMLAQQWYGVRQSVRQKMPA